MSKLFSPSRLGQYSLDNRIVVAPMCQYAADNGLANSWHAHHYANLALSGASLVIFEAAAVSPIGRISDHDLGLWDDQQATELKKIVSDIRSYSSAKLGIQIAHAGRKASTEVPWLGGHGIDEQQPRGWRTVAPSAIAFGDYPKPEALTQEAIQQIKQQFVDAALRAESAGFEVIELHAAHGYLLHQFLSPLSNQRQDQYGGNFEYRLRLLIETFTAVRAAVAEKTVIGVRISATDWVDGGWSLAESIELTERLEELGCDYIHVSSGGLSEKQQIPVGPNYQVPLAQAIRETTDIPVIAVGLITEQEQAEAIIATEQADFIALARGILYNPRWPWHAAAKLGATIHPAPQYLRCAPHLYKNLFS